MIKAPRAAAVLETPRLTLRRLSGDDAPFILVLLNDPSFLQYIGDRGVRSIEDARRYILDGPVASYARFGFGLYLVVERATGAAAGICGLVKREALEHVDIGFAFLPPFRRRGFGREAARVVLADARAAHRLARVAAITSRDNVASIGLLEGLGFRFDRLVRLSALEPELNLFLRELEDIA